jgi:hypothetical protein
MKMPMPMPYSMRFVVAGCTLPQAASAACSASRDEEQLNWATDQGRVIYTHNASDFCRLHASRLQEGRRHAGIIIGDQQTVSIGAEMRRLLKLGDAKTAEAM